MQRCAAHVRAPSAPVEKTAADVAADRKEDRLLTDPVAAYAERHDALVNSLTRLRNAELKRTDRLEPWSAEPPVLEVKDLCIQFPRYGDVNVVDHLNFSVRPGRRWGSSASPAAASRRRRT